MSDSVFAVELQEWLSKVAASGKVNNLTSVAMLCRALKQRACHCADSFGVERSAVEDSFDDVFDGEVCEDDLELHELLGIEAPASLREALA